MYIYLSVIKKEGNQLRYRHKTRKEEKELVDFHHTEEATHDVSRIH